VNERNGNGMRLNELNERFSQLRYGSEGSCESYLNEKIVLRSRQSLDDVKTRSDQIDVSEQST